MFSSHIPGYHIIQKFRCEEDQNYSSRIYRPGSGIGILIKQGISYNLKEWACWQDQILTAIIFESNLKIFGAQNLKGIITISVYRSQEEKDKKVFYDKLKDILDRIQTRYQHARVMGHDATMSDKYTPLIASMVHTVFRRHCRKTRRAEVIEQCSHALHTLM